MSRREGTLKLSSNIEPRAAAPLDARTIVPTLADLTASGAFAYPYVGMIVSVQGTGKAYMLTASDTTVAANWKEIGGGSSDSVPALDTVPENPEEGDVFLYTGETTASFVKGYIYQYQTSITTKRTLAIHNNSSYEGLKGYFNEQGEYQSDTSSWTNLTLIRNTTTSFNDGTDDYHLTFREDTHQLLTYNMRTGDRYSVTLDLYSETDPVFAIDESIVREGVLDFGFNSIWSYDIVDTGWKQINPNTFNEDDFTVANNEVGLKHKEWTGTHDEWDALTSAEKAVYDGCKINFTDDDNPNDIKQWLADQLELSDYEVFHLSTTPTIAQYDGELLWDWNTESSGHRDLSINGTIVAHIGEYDTNSPTTLTCAIKKGDSLAIDSGEWGTIRARWYKKRDYSLRT